MDYRYTIEETSAVLRQLNVDVERSVFQARYRDAVLKTQRRTSLKGFRPGRVPLPMVEKLYGSKLRREIIQEFFQLACNEAVREHSLKVIGFNSVAVDEDANDGSVLSVRAELALLPEPTIEGYLDVKGEVKLETFSPEAVDQQIEVIREMRAPIRAVSDRTKAVRGDVATVSFSLLSEGEPVEGIGSENQQIRLGTGRFHQQVEEEIVGMELGSERNILATLPEDFARPTLAGKEVTFAVQLLKLEELELAEVTDDFARETGLGETVQQMREGIEAQLRRTTEESNRSRRLAKILDLILAENPFDVPQLLVDTEIRQILVEERFIDPKKVDVDQIDVTRFREIFGTYATDRVRRNVVLNQIEKQEQIQVSRADVGAWLEKLLGDSYGQTSAALDIERSLTSERVQAGARRDKVVELLLSRAQISEESAGPPPAKIPQKKKRESKKES